MSYKNDPKEGILIIKKHIKTALKTDIVVVDNEEDRRLITGEVLSDNSKKYQKGKSIIFGKYALYQLTLTGDDIYFIEEEDIIGTTSYKEN